VAIFAAKIGILNLVNFSFSEWEVFEKEIRQKKRLSEFRKENCALGNHYKKLL